MIPTAAVGAAAFTLTTQTASAFFPPITGPGTGGPVTVSPPPPPGVAAQHGQTDQPGHDRGRLGDRLRLGRRTLGVRVIAALPLG
ncbi:MAG TPA: hypothetical protein VM533_09300, partial [Fimbriiglobus sp.]|nr:hypothetical protein [Fimbriiglobus sp.]